MAQLDKPTPQRDKTLRKGLLILEILTRGGEMSLSDIATAAGLSKGNAHQLLQTLVDIGYVHQDAATARYDAALKLWEVGMHLYERLDLVTPCLAAMEQLSIDTRETINLAMLDGGEVVYLHKIDSLEPVRSFTRVGGRAPAYCVATGKVLLAHDPQGPGLWRELDLAPFSDATLTDTEALVAELLETKARGYSINRGEWRGAVWGLAAPIHGWSGRVRLAIGIAGPGERLTPERLEALAPLVCKAAAVATEAIGGRDDARA